MPRLFPLDRRLILGVSLAAVLACSGETPAQSGEPGKKAKAPTPVVVIRATKHPVEDVFLVREATLQPISSAEISTRQEGFIKRRLVEEGDVLHANDPIIEMDRTDRELRLLELRASLQNSRATLGEEDRRWTRVQKLHAQQVISEGELDDTRAALERAHAEVDEVAARVQQAEQALNEMTIRAPMDSIVSQRFVETGEYLERGDPVVRLKRIDAMIAMGTVSERYLHDVHEGAPAILNVTAFPDRTFEGLVWKIIPDAELQSRSFPVWILVQNPNFRLKPGMSARVSFTRHVENAVLVPKDAVSRESGEAHLFVIQDEKAERRVIELGEAIGDRWHIRSGLQSDELVVVTGNEDLETGDAVQLVELPPPGPPTLPDSMNAAHEDNKGS